MRIGYVVPSWPPHTAPNGIVTYVDQISQAAGNGECVILPRKYDGSLDPLQRRVVPPENSRSARLVRHGLCRILRFGGSKVAPVGFLDELARQVGKAQRLYGLQLVEMEESFGWARLLQDKVDVPVAVRLHGPWFLTGRAENIAEDELFFQRVEQEGQAIRQAEYLTSPSRDVLGRVRDYYQIDLNHALVIPNPASLPAGVQRWSSPSSELGNILFVGRFDRLKGADLVLLAFQDLARTNSQLTLTMVGPDRGIEVDGQKLQFDNYCRYVGVVDSIKRRISFLGSQPPKKIWGLRQRCSLMLIASRYETFSYAALEALLAGTPTVFSKIGGIPEILEDGVTGLGFKAGDSGDMAAKIRSLLSNPCLATRMSEAAIERAKIFHPDVLINLFHRYYQSRPATLRA